MSESAYDFEYDAYGNTSRILVHRRGMEVLENSYTNKGTAFDHEEIRSLGLSGLLPPSPRSLEKQVANSAKKVDGKPDDIERYIYIRSLFDRNVTLAHALIASHVKRYMGIIYTPTVGLACQRYSSIFRKANGLHFYPGNIDSAEDILKQLRHRDIRVAVVTDNQGILGIGDQGAGGIAICLGKLMLYTQGAGIAPWHCLPISLDVGTDNQALLDDPEYLGWRHGRLIGEEYVRFVQRFAKAFKTVYPNALCQWEDFSKQKAFAIRDAYLHDLISFNDDIQGTGGITLAAILAAMRTTGAALGEQTYLVHGAGAGGVGVAEQIEAALIEGGMRAAEARARIYTLDRLGMVIRRSGLEPYKEKFAKDPMELDWFNAPPDGSLANVVKKARVTVLIGTSGQGGCFSRAIVESMLDNAERPVILPLSNPTSMAEALPADLHQWTGGRALVATGSPFEPVRHGGESIRIGQCNNVFIFPGVGLGILASGAREVLPEFFTAAAKAVANHVSDADVRRGVLCPAVEALREVSVSVAQAVGEAAIGAGVSGLSVYSDFQHNNDPERLRTLIEGMRWRPQYLPLVPA